MKKYLLSVIAFFALNSVCASEQLLAVQVCKFECREYTNGYVLVVKGEGVNGPVYTIVARKGEGQMRINQVVANDGSIKAEGVAQPESYNRCNETVFFAEKGVEIFSLNFGKFEVPFSRDGFSINRQVPYGEEDCFEKYFTAANAYFQLGGQPYSCAIL